MVRRLASVLAASIVLLMVTGTGTALAQTEKSFTLPNADVVVRVQESGALRVTEHLTYAFNGTFSGGYREIPLQEGETIADVVVREGNTEYRPGASAELGSAGAPDTFGTTEVGDHFRIVWHYSAFSENRTFTVSYTLNGLTVVYDDVAHVYLQVWGDEWKVPLEHLTARVILPEPVSAPDKVRIWGHPASVPGQTKRDPNGRGASLEADAVPAGRFVEMSLVFPRELLTAGPRAQRRRMATVSPRSWRRSRLSRRRRTPIESDTTRSKTTFPS